MLNTFEDLPLKHQFNQRILALPAVRESTERKLAELQRFYEQGTSLYGSFGETFENRYGGDYQVHTRRLGQSIYFIDLYTEEATTATTDKMEQLTSHVADTIRKARIHREEVAETIREMRNYVSALSHTGVDVKSATKHRERYEAAVRSLNEAIDGDLFPVEIKVRMADTVDRLQSTIDRVDISKLNQSNVGDAQYALVSGEEDLTYARTLLAMKHRLEDERRVANQVAKERHLRSMQEEIKQLVIHIVSLNTTGEEDEEPISGMSSTEAVELSQQAYSLESDAEGYYAEKSFDEIVEEVQGIRNRLRAADGR